MNETADQFDDDDDDGPEINQDAPILAHTELLNQINACLANTISYTQLSSWAVDHFYKIEMGEERPDPAYEDAMLAVLDDLMFSDEPGFALDETSLRALAKQLGRS